MVLLESSSRTATTTSPDQKASRLHRGVRLYLNIATAHGSGNLTVQVQGLDPASNTWSNVTDFNHVSSAGVHQYELYPGSIDGSVTGVQVQGSALPRSWRAVVTHSASGTWVYTLGADLLP